MGNWWRRPLGEYNGHLMRCAPGTHEAAGELIRRHVDRHARVLDLASGTGAFLTRLRNMGFTDLSAVELNVEGFAVEGITPRAVDLNQDFAGEWSGSQFGLVTAIEIIEHLDSPRHFLRNIHTLLNDGGYLLLTTPNVSHWLGRLRFAMSGELRQFQRHDYDYQRHISPITDVQMRLIFEELGFELVESTTAGTFFGPVKQAIFSPVTLLARAAMGNRSIGDVGIYLARKAGSTTNSAGKDSLYFKTTGA